MPEKTVYDARTARRLRNFFTLALNVLSERRANFNKPEHYQMPEWECTYIEQIIKLIDTKLLGNLVLDNDENRCFLDAYEVAQRIYHDRIMNMHHYYLETSKMIDRCNEQVQDRPVSLILKLGVPRKKAA
jgi:hypothetical protein